MKIIKNEKLVERNAKISQWLNIGGLLVLGLGLYITFSRQDLFQYAWICLLVGFISSQVGMYMTNRWGRKPRPDEKLDLGLKGMHSEFSIYHYSSPVSHLLVGPAGVWVIRPYHQGGKIRYEKNRWKNSGGGFAASYMRIFGQENIGRPDLEAESEISIVQKFFKKNMGDTAIPEVKAVLVFTNDNVELEVNDSPLPAMKLKQVKDFMRQMSKSRVLTNQQIVEITSLLPKE